MPKQSKQKHIPLHRKLLTKYEPKVDMAEDIVRSFDGLIKRRESFLQELEKAYDKSENPMFAWTAWDYARGLKLPIPPWVFEYLDGCARALVDSPRNDKISDDEFHTIKMDIPALLGFSSKAPFVRFREWYIKLDAVSFVRTILELDSKSKTAFRQAADMVKERYGEDRSERTIKNWHNEIE